MLNKKVSQFILLAILSIGIGLSFQNCSPGSSFETLGQEDESSHWTQSNSGGTDTNPNESGEVTTNNKLLMDRKVMYSLFIDIFGIGAEEIGSLRSTLKQGRFVLGGPCSYYENFKTMHVPKNGEPTRDANSENCVNSESASNLGAPLMPTANSIQQAIINDVCYDIMNAKDKMTNEYPLLAVLLKKIDPSVAIPASSEKNALTLFELFYRGKPQPPASLIFAIQTLLGPNPTVASWKQATLEVCLSNHWQVL